MDFYSKEQLKDFENQKFAFLEVVVKDNVLTITLDRANKKNALHPQMINEIAYAMNYAYRTKEVWIIVLEAKGNVFCAGGDLKAMAGFIEENDSTIPNPNGEILIGELFNKVYKPTIAKVTGDVYAGGFLMLASCNIVIAQDNIKLGLPEVKRGLFPFQVMAALFRVMPVRKVIDWCIRGYNLPIEEAKQFGLVSQIATTDTIEQDTSAIIAELKQNSPTAIQKGLEAFDKIQPAADEHKYLMQMFMETIGTKDGQEGLRAFREKRQANWIGE